MRAVREPAPAGDESRGIVVEDPCLSSVEVKRLADRARREAQRVFYVVGRADGECELAHKTELFICSLSPGDVVQESVEVAAPARLLGGDRQLHWKLVAVSMQGGDLETLVQSRAFSGREEALESAPVSFAVLMRDYGVREDAAERLLSGPAEGALRFRIPVGDQSVGVHRDERLVGGVDDRPQLPAAPLDRCSPILRAVARLGNLNAALACVCFLCHLSSKA